MAGAQAQNELPMHCCLSSQPTFSTSSKDQMVGKPDVPPRSPEEVTTDPMGAPAGRQTSLILLCFLKLANLTSLHCVQLIPTVD